MAACTVGGKSNMLDCHSSISSLVAKLSSLAAMFAEGRAQELRKFILDHFTPIFKLEHKCQHTLVDTSDVDVVLVRIVPVFSW